MRVVFDANILVRAFVNQHGSASEALQSMLTSSHTLILSSGILHEVITALRRPRLLSVHGKDEQDIYQFVEWLRHAATLVSPDVFANAPIRDRDDMLVLQTAIASAADVICTLDRDFFAPPASEFLTLRRIAVMTDVELLHRLRQ